MATMATQQQQQGIKREREEEQDQKRQRVEATPVAVPVPVPAPSLAGVSYQPPAAAVAEAPSASAGSTSAVAQQDQIYLVDDVKWEDESPTSMMVYGPDVKETKGRKTIPVGVINSWGERQEVNVQLDNVALCFDLKLSERYGNLDANTRIDDQRPDIMSFNRRADARNLKEIKNRKGFCFDKPMHLEDKNIEGAYSGLEVIGKFKNPTKDSKGMSTNEPDDERWGSTMRHGIRHVEGRPKIPLTNLDNQNVYKLSDFKKFMRVNMLACYYEIWLKSNGESGMKGHAKCLQLVPRRDPMAERCLSSANMDRLRSHEQVFDNGRLVHQDYVVEAPTAAAPSNAMACDGAAAAAEAAAQQNKQEEDKFLNKFLDGAE